MEFPFGVVDTLPEAVANELLAYEHWALQGDVASDSCTPHLRSQEDKAQLERTIAPNLDSVSPWTRVLGSGVLQKAQAALNHWVYLPARERNIHVVHVAAIGGAVVPTLLSSHAGGGFGFVWDGFLLGFGALATGVLAPLAWSQSNERYGRCPAPLTAIVAPPAVAALPPDVAAPGIQPGVLARGTGVRSVFTRWLLEFTNAWVVMHIVALWGRFLPTPLALLLLAAFNAEYVLGAVAAAGVDLNGAAATRFRAAWREHGAFFTSAWNIYVVAIAAGLLCARGEMLRETAGVNSVVLLMAAAAVLLRPGAALRAMYAAARAFRVTPTGFDGPAAPLDPLSNVVSVRFPAADAPLLSPASAVFSTLSAVAPPAAVRLALTPRGLVAGIFALVSGAEIASYILPCCVTGLVTSVLAQHILVPLLLLRAVTLAAAHARALRTPLLRPLATAYSDGVFDLCHAGHKRQLERGATFADRLVVGVMSDADCVQYKRAPIMTERERADEVRCCYGPTAIIIGAPDKGLTPAFLRENRIDVLLFGEEYNRVGDHYYEVGRRNGMAMATPRFDGISSSALIKRVRDADPAALVAKVVSVGGPAVAPQ